MKRQFTIFCLVAALTPLSVGANTYTVSNTNDWFWGSLRAAIDDANGHPGPDTIVFAIGSGPQTIHLNSELPIIIDAVTIDGRTQPGFVGNPVIELDGTNVTTGTGLLVAAPGVVIRSLAINHFGRNGIGIGDDFLGHVPSGTVVQGCWIGLRLDGSTGVANQRDGIRVYANDCVIGGDGPNQANVISSNTGNGISIGKHPWTGQSSSDRGLRTHVQGNIIGLTANGLFARPNGACGIEVIGGTDNLIGGDTPALGNIISANGAEGVRIDPFDGVGGQQQFVLRTVVKNNKIGVSKNGGSVGNGLLGGGPFAGVAGFAPQSTIVQNVIANNGGPGVLIRVKSGTTITNNSILNNGGLGIDLGFGISDTGVTPNDPGDGDTGGNNLLNFPVILTAINQSPNTVVTGTYQGAPSQTFTLEFYKNSSCDSSGNGEGEGFLGTASVTTDGSGNGSFSATLAWAGIGGIVTATARDGLGNTSEFSNCRQATFAPPSISGLSQTGGRVGTVIDINGTGLIWVNSVKFFDGANNTVSANYTVVSDVTVRVTVPFGAKIGPILVSGNFGSAYTPSFRVTPPKGDFTGDGQPDLLWRNYGTGDNSLWIGGSPAGGITLQAVPDVNWQIEGTGDFNNDGSHDIVWRNQATGDTGIWLMTGTALTGWAGLPPVTNANWYIEAVGDFNGDGGPDLVWRNRATGDGTIWFMNGASFSGTSAALPNEPLEWKIEAAADFNLDGSTDLLWRNTTTGEVTIWYMNGATWTGGYANLQTVADPSWTIEQAADWDQDGDFDIVWRNVTTGQNTVWLLVGPAWTGSYVDLTPIADSNWRIEDFF